MVEEAEKNRACKAGKEASFYHLALVFLDLTSTVYKMGSLIHKWQEAGLQPVRVCDSSPTV